MRTATHEAIANMVANGVRSNNEYTVVGNSNSERKQDELTFSWIKGVGLYKYTLVLDVTLHQLIADEVSHFFVAVASLKKITMLEGELNLLLDALKLKEQTVSNPSTGTQKMNSNKPSRIT